MAALTLVLSEQGLDPNQFVYLRGHLSCLGDDYRGESGTASGLNSLTDSDRSSGSSSDPRKESDSTSAHSGGINSSTSGTGEISESDEVFSNTISPVSEKVNKQEKGRIFATQTQQSFPGGNELEEEKTNERSVESAEVPLKQTMTESTEQPILISIEQPVHELIKPVKVEKKRKNKIHYLGRDILKLDKNTQPHTWQLTSPLYGFFSPHIFGNYGCYFRFENGSSIEEYPMQKCNDCDFYSPSPYS